MSLTRTDGPAIRQATVAVSDLRLHPENPRRGDVASIKESLERNGLFAPLTVNARSLEVLKGNHTLCAARELGWTEIDVYLVDVSEQAARRIVLADNRTSDLATYDFGSLAELLSGFEDLAGTGYDESDLDDLLEQLAAGQPLPDDELPPLRADPATVPGELVELGLHRLVCGDAADPAVYERLLGDERVEVVVTDPPYGVDYVGKTADRLQIRNDGRAGLEQLLTAVFANLDRVLVAGAPVYVFHPAGALAEVFMRVFGAQGWRLRQGLVWVKDSIVLGRSDYHSSTSRSFMGSSPAPAGAAVAVRAGTATTSSPRCSPIRGRVRRESIRR